MLPTDILAQIEFLFPEPERVEVTRIIEGSRLTDRENRCLLRYSCGDLERLRYIRGMAGLDRREVAMLGEHEYVGDEFVHVWDLSEPFVTLPQDWRPIATSSDPDRFAIELAREITPDHSLAGVKLRSIYFNNNDDVLFVRENGRICCVHLTYKKEATAESPHVIEWQSFTDAARGLKK